MADGYWNLRQQQQQQQQQQHHHLLSSANLLKRPRSDYGSPSYSFHFCALFLLLLAVISCFLLISWLATEPFSIKGLYLGSMQKISASVLKLFNYCVWMELVLKILCISIGSSPHVAQKLRLIFFTRIVIWLRSSLFASVHLLLSFIRFPCEPP